MSWKGKWKTIHGEKFQISPRGANTKGYPIETDDRSLCPVRFWDNNNGRNIENSDYTRTLGLMQSDKSLLHDVKLQSVIGFMEVLLFGGLVLILNIVFNEV